MKHTIVLDKQNYVEGNISPDATLDLDADRCIAARSNPKGRIVKNS